MPSPQALVELLNPFLCLSLVRQRPAVQDSTVRPPVRKSLVCGEVESGCSMSLDGMPLAAEMMAYSSFAQGETQAQRMGDLLRQGHCCLAPCQCLVRIAKIPQRPGVTAATRHTHVLSVEERRSTVLVYVVQN